MNIEVILSILTTLGIPFIILVFASVRVVNEYERGVKFTFGRYTKLVTPGWRIVWPIIQKMVKVDVRVKAVDVPDQEAITQDNVSLRISAVIYYKIGEASQAILAVENFYYAMSQLAQTTMRNVVGEVSLDNLLKQRDEIADKIRGLVDKSCGNWGIIVEAVELKDIMLPDDLKRTMAKEAEAVRERRADIVKAEGELIASENLAKAAFNLTSSPGALHLRTLSTINDLSSDQSNTTIWMVPIESLRALEAVKDFMVSQTKK